MLEQAGKREKTKGSSMRAEDGLVKREHDKPTTFENQKGGRQWGPPFAEYFT
jgi:hypothetical protein